MSIQLAGLIALALGVLFLVKGPHFAIFIFVPSTLLGSCAAVLLGSATIQPAHLLLGFLAIAILSNAGSWSFVLESAAFPREGFWLVATACYGVVGSYLLPRIFAGATYVNAVGATEFGLSVIQVPLGPTSGNVTQSIYFVGDVICFLLCYALASTKVGFRAIFGALVLYSSMNIVFAFADLITFYTGTSFLLEFIRNSTYAIYTDTVISGLKRIIGSFTEASAFAYATIGAFGFTLRLWLGGVRPRLTFALALANMLLLIFSTSTTAYAGLPLLIACLFATSTFRTIGGAVPNSVYSFLIFSPLLVILLTTIILLNPTAANVVYSFLNTLLFDKASSDSAMDRGTWNQGALNAFYATYGLGAGLGSVRASSFLLAVLANLGAVGVATYGMFIGMTIFNRERYPLDWFTFEVRAAARTACIAILIAASISGALADLGLPFFILAGLACAATELGRRQATHSTALPTNSFI
jgi:hypothetical protein